MISSIADLDWMEEAVDAMVDAGALMDTEPVVFTGLMPEEASGWTQGFAGSQPLQNMS
jgi:hypothetical protein